MACMPPSLPSSHQSPSSACLTVLYIHTYTHTAAAVAAAVAVASTLVMGPPKKASLPPPSLSAPSHLCCCSISCHPTFLPSSGSSCHHTTHTTPLALLVITPPTPHLWLFLSSLALLVITPPTPHGKIVFACPVYTCIPVAVASTLTRRLLVSPPSPCRTYT